jgi:hypothetical protein
MEGTLDGSTVDFAGEKSEEKGFSMIVPGNPARFAGDLQWIL